MVYRVLKQEPESKVFEPLKVKETFKTIEKANDAAIAWVGKTSGRVAIVIVDRFTHWSKAEVDCAPGSPE